MSFKVIIGDITKLEVDAIVNAANPSLLGGGGVDGAIHRAAGRELYNECKTLGGCRTGEAKITKGYNLPAKYVIHTVGPKYYEHSPEQADSLLRKCYSICIELAVQNSYKSIAFPAISTGVYGFPKERAAKIAVDTLSEFLSVLKDKDSIDIIFVCFDDETYGVYKRLLKEHGLKTYGS